MEIIGWKISPIRLIGLIRLIPYKNIHYSLFTILRPVMV